MYILELNNFFEHITIYLFFIGLLGIILIKKNVIITIMSIEIMLLAVNLNFIFASLKLNDIIGYLSCLFILIIAAAEAAIGLAIIINYYRLNGTITYNFIQNLKG